MDELTDTKADPDPLARIAAAMAAAGDVAYEWDIVSDSFRWLAGAEALFGALITEPLKSGTGFNAHIDPDDLPARLDALSNHFYGRAPYDCEYRLRSADGSVQWVHDQGEAELSALGAPIRLRGVLRRLGERKQHEARLAFLANYDELTGHYNRSRLRDSLEHSVYYAQRYGVSGAFLVVGIDKMTLINDAFGHEVADAVIVALAKRLSQVVRVSDTIGRMGGDRFGIVLSNCPEAEVAAAADKLLQFARDTVVHTSSGPIHATVSIGAMPFPTNTATASEVISKAEIALNQAKRAGRDCFVLYANTEDSRERHRERIVVAQQVQRALQENRLALAFQPVVDAITREAVSYEALLRLITPGGDVVAAGKFMPVVEELGLIRLVDRRALDLAIRELSRFSDARLALNVSGLTVTNRAWLDAVKELLRGYPELSGRLTIEITETAALEDFDECGRFVHQLHDLGCKVALDDFGAGYTSFRHLKALAVDIVKIDGSFIRNIDKSPDNLIFVRTLLGLANSFHLSTVAECVERMEEADLLAREGVHFLQGYAFGAPSLERPWYDSAADRPVKLALSPGG